MGDGEFDPCCLEALEDEDIYKHLMGPEHRAVVILPLYLFDHSGISMSTDSSNFWAQDSAGWDWGKVGLIWVERKQVLKEFGTKRITKKIKALMLKVLGGEVETYNQYLTGDVWGYVVRDRDGEEKESCWGFYGSEDCLAEAKGIVDWLPQQLEMEMEMELAEA